MAKQADVSFRRLNEASGREASVVLAAMVMPHRAPVLSWLDPYSEKGRRGEPYFYEPKRDDFGSVFYNVPIPYASRLLSNSPEKFCLVSPELASMQVLGKNGGQRFDLVNAKVRKRADKEGADVARDGLGKPMWFDKDELKENEVAVGYGNS